MSCANDGAIVHGAEGQGPAAAHVARRRRPAQGRRRRLRDLRQVRRARRNELRPEHQPSARARRRTVAHHPRARPGAGRARASRAARAPAVLARQAGSLRPRSCSRCAARSKPQQVRRHPPSGRLPRSTASSPNASRSSTRPAGCSPTAPRDDDDPGATADERKAALRAPPARAGRGDRHLGGRPGPRASPAYRRFRLQPRHRRPRTNSIRTAACCARARRARNTSASAATARTARSRSATNCRRHQQRRPRRPATRDQSRKTEEIVNYEISRTTKTEVIEGGRVNRVSVAVLVDGNYTKNDKGEVIYQPRDKEEIDRIAALVRSAIGFDQKRGDQVEVVNLRFAETPNNADRRADRLDVAPAVHQRRHHARRRAAGDGAARPRGAAHGGAAAGSAHHRAATRAGGAGGRPSPAAIAGRRRRRRASRPAHHRRRGIKARAERTPPR